MFEVISGTVQTAQKVVLYGPEGIGKSSLVAQFLILFLSTRRINQATERSATAEAIQLGNAQAPAQWVKRGAGSFRFTSLLTRLIGRNALR